MYVKAIHHKSSYKGLSQTKATKVHLLFTCWILCILEQADNNQECRHSAKATHVTSSWSISGIIHWNNSSRLSRIQETMQRSDLAWPHPSVEGEW